MEGLVKYKPGTDGLVPGIAESWTVSEDGAVWTFKLKQNVSFCDGKRLTAEDVVRSVKRVMSINGDPAWLVTDFVANVTALDDYTVRFELATPPTSQYTRATPKKSWAMRPGVAGPYCIAEFKRDEYIVLRENPYYHGEKPKTKEIVVKFYRDATSLGLALENGEVDIAWRTLRPQDYVDLQKKPNFVVESIPGTFIRYIIVNVKMSPVDNVLVRKAIAAAISRTEIASTVFYNTMSPLYSLVPA
jgi:peptide/nickel transport system substrate-binding protein